MQCFEINIYDVYVAMVVVENLMMMMHSRGGYNSDYDGAISSNPDLVRVLVTIWLSLALAFSHLPSSFSYY